MNNALPGRGGLWLLLLLLLWLFGGGDGHHWAEGIALLVAVAGSRAGIAVGMQQVAGMLLSLLLV